MKRNAIPDHYLIVAPCACNRTEYFHAQVADSPPPGFTSSPNSSDVVEVCGTDSTVRVTALNLNILMGDRVFCFIQVSPPHVAGETSPMSDLQVCQLVYGKYNLWFPYPVAFCSLPALL